MSKVVKKIIKYLVVLVLVLGGASWIYAYMASSSVTKNASAPTQENMSWMKQVDDDTDISNITIPGTHDSATCFVQVPYLAKCQVIPIDKQLECGYRYLDIRLKVKDNKLYLVHGPCACKTDIAPWSDNLELSDVLEMCYTFLDNNPSETVIFAIKSEDKNQDISQFQTLLNSYIQKDTSKWLLTNTIPTLKECRGKCVLVRRFEDVANLGDASGMPIMWQDQKGVSTTPFENGIDPDTTHSLVVQDRFEYEVEPKLDSFKNTLNAANISKDTLVLNFLSTKGPHIYGCPYQHAKDLNPSLMELNLNNNKYNGWIVIDFATANEAKEIYSTNL